jgi:hypothetical protein
MDGGTVNGSAADVRAGRELNWRECREEGRARRKRQRRQIIMEGRKSSWMMF